MVCLNANHAQKNIAHTNDGEGHGPPGPPPGIRPWPVDFTGVQFADHCNQVDVIPALEWTQVNWGFCGFMLDSGMGLLDFPGLEFCWS